jgi:LPPG:FO 2-phospho-L-lactate transferase
MLVVLTGGTGGAKLIQGLSCEADPAELTVVCNTGDDFVFQGLHISPDLDTIMYTLAKLVDGSKGWGIEGDTFTVLEWLGKLGAETWFRLGDKDLAIHIRRTGLLNAGLSLSEVTARLKNTLEVGVSLLPMTDDRVETRVVTPKGELSFQEYFVKERWQPQVTKVFYAGVEKSRPAPGLIEAIRKARGIIICPSNPVTSIGPILAVPGLRDAIREGTGSVIGISPIIGDTAISGPAHKLMKTQGWDRSALGVATGYADLLDVFFIDDGDRKLEEKIAALDIEVVVRSIRMDSLVDKRRLARDVLALVQN